MKKIWLGVIMVCLVFLFAGVWQKHETETSSRTVEFSLSYDHLTKLGQKEEREEIRLPHLLMEAKDSGISSVSLSFMSFGALEERGLAELVNGSELVHLVTDSPLDTESLYLLLYDEPLSEEVEEWFHGRLKKYEKVRMGAGVAYRLDGYSESFLRRLYFPPLKRDIERIGQAGLSVVAVLPDTDEANNRSMSFSVVKEWGEKGLLSKIRFAGYDVWGYPDAIRPLSSFVPDTPLVYTESLGGIYQQKGMNALIKASDYQAVRGHTIGRDVLHAATADTAVLEERLEKAIQERNVRFVHFEPAENHSSTSPYAEWEALKKTMEAIQPDVSEKGFSFGIAKPFEPHESRWVMGVKPAFAVLTATLFALLASLFFSRLLSVVVWVGTLLSIAVGQWLSPDTLWMLLPLFFVILCPVLLGAFLLRWLPDRRLSWGSSVLLFVGISLASVVFGLALTSLYGDVASVLHVRTFRGVRAAHLLPILLLFLLIWVRSGAFSLSPSWLTRPVRLMDALLVVAVAGLGWFYLSRTGNGGTVLPFELSIRSFLQETLPARPRTKEFLLGHPLLLVILFFLGRFPWLKWLLPVALIGQLSILNTFSHLHTPVFLSVTRSLVGMGLGLLLGLLLIGVCLLANHWWQKRKVSKKA